MSDKWGADSIGAADNSGHASISGKQHPKTFASMTADTEVYLYGE
ncbi:MAG: hypothetical protein QME32_07575 [Endomicrobiia bacterium]|nr:hypothetical protein [Endomicrobiia bacterium]